MVPDINEIVNLPMLCELFLVVLNIRTETMSPKLHNALYLIKTRNSKTFCGSCPQKVLHQLKSFWIFETMRISSSKTPNSKPFCRPNPRKMTHQRKNFRIFENYAHFLIKNPKFKTFLQTNSAKSAALTQFFFSFFGNDPKSHLSTKWEKNQNAKG